MGNGAIRRFMVKCAGNCPFRIASTIVGDRYASRRTRLTNDGLMFSDLATSAIDPWVPSNSLRCHPAGQAFRDAAHQLKLLRAGEPEQSVAFFTIDNEFDCAEQLRRVLDRHPNPRRPSADNAREGKRTLARKHGHLWVLLLSASESERRFGSVFHHQLKIPTNSPVGIFLPTAACSRGLAWVPADFAKDPGGGIRPRFLSPLASSLRSGAR